MTSLVLLHGITESRASWDPLIDPLSVDPATGNERTVATIDLRGHGTSTRTGPFDLATMATDAMTAIGEAGLDPNDTVIIGHSLGGTVVTAMASVADFKGVINVDQPLKLADFQAGLQQMEPMLRGDENSFNQAIVMLFDSMRGPLPGDEFDRIGALRQPEQSVVLDVWTPVLELSTDELDAMVEGMTATIASPYLSLHGIDPGPDYGTWLAGQIANAELEVWADQGHYPHLVDPDRFVARVNEFVAGLGS